MSTITVYGDGKHYCTEQALASVEMPKQTSSYVPIRHDKFVEMVSDHVDRAGIKIVEASHTLARKGQRYFGIMKVEPKEFLSEGMGFLIGLRSSYDKSVPAQICAGQSIMVCSNMCFSGAVTVGRRHTTNLFADLPAKIDEAIGKMIVGWKSLIDRMNSYREIDITNSQAHDLVIRGYQNGAISKTQIADVVEQWHNPNFFEFKPRNLYSLHNAFTEVWKGNHAGMIPAQSDALHGVLDGLLV